LCPRLVIATHNTPGRYSSPQITEINNTRLIQLNSTTEFEESLESEIQELTGIKEASVCAATGPVCSL